MPKKKSKMLKITLPEETERHIALYLRVSTDRQAEEGYSIEVQKERLKAYVVAKYGPDVDYDFYIDDGYSGGSLERPMIKRIIDLAKIGYITDVIVYKLDRLSRSQKDTLYLIEDVFLSNNVSFSSIQESFDTSTPFGRAVVGILSVFAQLERENIFERTRSGMKKRVENGLWPGGGGIPFGYDYNPGTGVLVPNQDAPKVKAVFELYLQGKGMQAIANILDLDYEKLTYQILTRRTYLGKIVYNGVEYDGMHQPLISEKLFLQVQNKLHERSVRKAPINHDYLLVGLCRCAECGAKMRYQKWGKAGAKIVCYSQQTSKPYLVHDPNCQNRKFWADQIEKTVIEDMFRFAQDISDVKPEKQQKFSLLDTLTMEKKRAENQRRKLIKLFSVCDEASEEDLRQELAEIQKRIGELEEQIQVEANLSALQTEVKDIRKDISEVRDIWPEMSNVQKQDFLRQAIEVVEIGRDRINISYNF